MLFVAAEDKIDFFEELCISSNPYISTGGIESLYNSKVIALFHPYTIID